MTGVTERLRAIERGLAAVGLATRLHDAPSGMDLTATLRLPGQREIEVLVDEDGYTELRYWADLDVPPVHVVATITQVLAVIVPAQGSAAVVDAAGQAFDRVTSYDGAVTQRAGERGMPAPQDHVAEQERGPDQARPREPDHPREARAQPTDLQARLERLPVGHPSSPYRDDGSRKPPPPDLAQYELPIPDELPPDVEHSDRDLPTQESAHVGLDGSWDWKGSHLTLDQSRAGDRGLVKCREAEGRDLSGSYGDHGLTPAMRRVEAQLAHGHLAEGTEQHALKEPDRFKEKLAKLIIRHPGESVDELAAEIPDGVRYTFLSKTEDYVENFWDTSARLQESGFELRVRTNTWGSDEYKGVNTRWRDPDSNVIFEVQVHTYESLDAKERTHWAYEKVNDTTTTVEEVERLRAYQRGISAQVPLPYGWQGIPDYRKED